MQKLVSFPTTRAGRRPDSKEAAATGFYSPATAARLARVPRSRLYAWSRGGVVSPTVEITDIDGRTEHGYTFEELVYLGLLRRLRDTGVSLPKAVAVMQHLRDRFGPPGPGWQDAGIFTQGDEVFAERRDSWGATVATRAGQKVATLLFGDEFRELRDRADALLIPSEFRRFVEIDPELRSGMPVVRGTALQTSTLHRLYQRERSYPRVREAYPSLTPAQIKRAVAFERYLDSDAS